MAVPLVDKGVVVVAVGYDTAPKGRVSSFLNLFNDDKLSVSACAPFRQHGSDGISSTQKCRVHRPAVFPHQVIVLVHLTH